MIREQTRQRKYNVHRRRNAFRPLMDPEEQVKLDMLICSRHMERAYAGELVEPHVLAQPGARGRLEACLEPSFFAKMITERVIYGQPVNLEAIRETYPTAYAGYSSAIEYRMRQRAWQAEQAQRAAHEAFARVGETPCDAL